MTNFTKRYLANITFETTTPLKVGSSDLDMLQDTPVQKDFNELPMILGTSIAGVLRRHFSSDIANDLFGDEHSHQEDNKGSRLIISNALLCDENMTVQEKLLLEKSDFLKIFDKLISREHTAITDKGIAKPQSKFDEEVVYKGSRFKFRLELLGTKDDINLWNNILKTINTSTFRLGAGTTKGFGSIKVISSKSTCDIFELNSKAYREKTSSLNTQYAQEFPKDKNEVTNYTSYQLTIKPDDFFMFGSGFGDDEADMTPVYEKVVNYDKKALSEAKILIPATSIKGALSHRTSYHYNLQNKLYIGNDEAKTVINSIFGAAKNEDNEGKGKLLFSDVYQDKAKEKIFDHVSIDRFTGGGIDGALFQEKTIADDRIYEIEILMHKDVQEKEQNAFEAALTDITTGMLALGGATTKGHGIFSGTWSKS